MDLGKRDRLLREINYQKKKHIMDMLRTVAELKKKNALYQY